MVGETLHWNIRDRRLERKAGMMSLAVFAFMHDEGGYVPDVLNDLTLRKTFGMVCHSALGGR